MIPQRNEQRGAALLAVMIIIAALSGILTLFAQQLVADAHGLSREAGRSQLLAALDYGLTDATARLEAGDTAQLNFVPPAEDGEDSVRSIAMKTLTSISGASALEPHPFSGADIRAAVLHWRDDGRDNNGDNAIDDSGEADLQTIYVLATHGPYQRCAEVIVRENSDGRIEILLWDEWNPLSGDSPAGTEEAP